MPIADSELDQAVNAHLLRPAGDTVYRALTVWRETPGSYEWWWLIIHHGGQVYSALRFETLRALLADSESGVRMNTSLAALPERRNNPEDWAHPLPGVVAPVIVEQATMSTPRARQMMHESPGGLLIVLADGAFRGILNTSERTFAFADKPLLDMLEDFEQYGKDDTKILPPRPSAPLPPTGSDSAGEL